MELEPNQTGFHVLELRLVGAGDPAAAAAAAAAGGHGVQLEEVSRHTGKARFNIYKDEVKETRRFADWVDQLPDGRIKWVLPSRLDSADTVYAMTVHKAQGSEFGHTLLERQPAAAGGRICAASASGS